MPLHGSAGLFGPSCELCAQLAAEELNSRAGLLGRRIELRVVDGAGSPEAIARRVGALVTAGDVHAVVGWHLSAVRHALAPRLTNLVPYVYTALYEGGERTPGVFLTGETPIHQLLPAMRWLGSERGVRRWFMVGNDYVWPRQTALLAREFAKACSGMVCGEYFVPLGTSDFEPVLDMLEVLQPDIVLMLLVGDDAVAFNREFARRDLGATCTRLSTLMDENMLLASGVESTVDLWTASAYFETLVTPESLDFGGRYARRFGPSAPALSSMGESCYEGMRLLAALTDRAQSLSPQELAAVADGTYYGGPRGELAVRAGHVEPRIYLARADGLRFDVVASI